MNKLVTVLGVAAVATLAGCKDPNYKPMSASQDEVKVVEPAPPPATDVTPATPTCKCPPGTKHTSPCTCGAPDCQCVVEVKPVPPPEPEYTIYIVQNGDYLAKISKKYNLTIDAIKKLNGMKSDMIRVGQKLKLPGKIDVGEQKAPAKAKPAKKAAAKPAADYTGATKEYTVKNGDTLGAIAYANGLKISQLKKLNGLKGDALKVGQKLKVPAAKVEKPAKVEAPAKPKVEPEKPVEPETPVVSEPTEVEPAPVTAADPVETAPVDAPAPAVEAPAVQAEAPAAAASTYTIQEGDDMTGVSIRFGVSAAAIRELNGLGEDAQLTVGQVIKLPADAQQ